MYKVASLLGDGSSRKYSHQMDGNMRTRKSFVSRDLIGEPGKKNMPAAEEYSNKQMAIEGNKEKSALLRVITLTNV